MEIPTTLYPYELLPFLESLHAAAFTGRLELTTERGTTLLYLTTGRTRYATSTAVTGTFPAWLITEELFARERIHGWLRECTDEELALEELLLHRKVMNAESIVHLKSELSRAIFARAFCATAEPAVTEMDEDTLDFGDFALDPLEALFDCAANHPVYGAMLETLQGSWHRPMRRSPAFYTLISLFRRYFVGSTLALHLDAPTSLTELTDGVDDPQPIIAQVFALYVSGMVSFTGEEPRSRLFARAERRSPTGVNAPPRRPPAEAGVRVGARPTTQPGMRVVAAEPEARVSPPMDEAEMRRTRTQFFRPPPPVDETSSPEARAQRFADLHGGLVGQGLVDAAARAEGLDAYAILDVAPDAPLSMVRAAYLRHQRRYDEDAYVGQFLPGPAATALQALRGRAEEAYETLNDLRKRRAHDQARAVAGALGDAELDALFYAEGVFKAAQIRLAGERYQEAISLLRDAVERAPREPEYLAYLAFAIDLARRGGLEVTRRAGQPDELLDRALALDNTLESAWLFRARLALQAGDLRRAYTAYHQVTTSNPDNAEAAAALERFRAEGVELELISRGRLSERISQMLGRRR
jgi:tetratricopeptide (TPR) repeat protein